MDREKTLGMTDESSGTRPVVMERLKICQRGNAVEETVDLISAEEIPSGQFWQGDFR